MRKRRFIGFYNKYAPKIYRFVYLKVNSIQDAEDLTAEAFFRFWQSSQDKKISHPRALIYQIARNLVVDFYRRKPPLVSLETGQSAEENINPLEQLPDLSVDLVKQMETSSQVDQIKQGLKQIKDQYQDVIIWRYLDDLSPKEIAQILNKSEGSVRVLLHRAMSSLKKKMAVK